MSIGTEIDKLKDLTESAPLGSIELFAQMFVAEHGHEARYVPKWDAWMLWDGTRWKKDEQLQAFTMARRICTREARKLNEETLSRRIASGATYNAVLQVAGSDPKIVAPHDIWDLDLWLLNTPIGTVDLRTGEITKHNPAYYITKITKVSPKNGECRVWREHLKLVLGGDNDLIDYHQRLFGYAMTGFTKEKMFCFAHGEGNNGKSITFNSVSTIMGDYAQSASIDTFTILNNEQHPTGVAALNGARLVIVSETEAGKMLKESTIKLLTGGDKIKARFMRQDEFEYQPQLTLIIFGNHKPSLRSVNEAIRSRIHFLPYTVKIENVDKHFGEKLMVEGEEILHWMIEGAKIWHDEGLNPPQAVLDATEKYLAEQDKFQMFCDDYLDFGDKTAFTTTKIILKCQHDWAEQQNEWKMREKDLVEVMERKGCRYGRLRIKQGGNQERGFFGVQISEEGMASHLAERVAEMASPQTRTHFN